MTYLPVDTDNDVTVLFTPRRRVFVCVDNISVCVCVCVCVFGGGGYEKNLVNYASQ